MGRGVGAPRQFSWKDQREPEKKKAQTGALPKVPPASAALSEAMSPRCLLQDFQRDFVRPLKQGP